MEEDYNALHLEGKLDTGLELPSQRKSGFVKYKNNLKHLIPYRLDKRPKDEFPLAYAGCFSCMFYSWMSGLMYKIWRKGVKVLDTIHLSPVDATEHNEIRFERLWHEEVRKKGIEKASLWAVVFKAIRVRLLFTFIFILIMVAFSLLTPALVIRNFLDYLTAGDVSFSTGYLYILGLIFFEAGRSVAGAQTWISTYMTGIRVRNGFMGLLFKKILRLKGLKDKTVGELVNIVGNDAQRVFEANAVGPFILVAPITMVAGSIYGIFLLGPWSLIGCSIFLAFYPISGLISRLTTHFRRLGIGVTDRRVRMMTELLTYVKLIKLYAWEKPFANRIAEIRNEERILLEKSAYVQGISNGLAYLVPNIASVITFICMVASGVNLTVTEAFTYISLLNSMRFSLGVMPYSVKSLSELSVSLTRFKSLLVMEDIESLKWDVTNEDIAIEFLSANLSWPKTSDIESLNDTEEYAMQPNGSCIKINFPSTDNLESDHLTSSNDLEMTLKDINFTLKKSKIVGICGSVGSGKSSFISAILSRLDVVSGSVASNGSIAYVPQQAWIMNSTARENVLFGQPYDEDRYNEVIEACSLETDFNTFISGDLTEIGERGMNLSGGQKQRISLARAIYSNKDIVLLDDPLSAVDIHIGQHIFTNCIQGQLRDKTVIFVTHQLQYLPDCDEVIYLRDGQIAEQGTHVDLMARDGEYSSLVNLFNTEHTDMKDDIEDDPELEPNGDAYRARVVSFSKDVKDANGTPVARKRTISTSHDDQPVRARLERQYSTLSVDESSANKRLLERQFSTMSTTSEAGDVDGKLVMTEESDVGSVKGAVYHQYFLSIGGYGICLFIFSIFLGSVLAQTLTNWYLSHWLNQGSGNTSIIVDNITVISQSITDNPDKNYHMGIYSSFIFIMSFLLIFRTFLFMKSTLKASSKLHDEVFLKILSCPVSFFDSTPVGRIVNRFSADMDEIDIRLPMSAEVFINNVLAIMFSMGMIAYVTPWFLIPILPMAVFFVFLYLLFVKCVRELKREDSITRSPLLSHLTATIQGFTTIKAYNKDQEFLFKFRHLLDKNSVPYMIFYLSNRWLALRLDLITLTVNAITGLLIIVTFDKMNPALAGLALSFAIQMTGLFQFTIRLAVDTESRFTSVQRILDYSQNQATEATPNVSDKQPPADWPKFGDVSFQRLRMRYRVGLPLALKGITFNVHSQEKIGIVGRSGSGKSSLGVALFRLVEAASGSIFIDNYDISKVSLETLRSRMAIIPQDPVLFVGTIRYNLDPFGNHSDDELWEVLEKCHVKETVVNLDLQLDAMVVENGENFSVGERQLICMARALLRHSKILILDEATAAIDTEKDALIQATIKEAFADCTMLTIAHRLNTVLSCDRILVVEDGKVVEYDKPSVLMANPKSKFKNMLEATEKQTKPEADETK